MARKLKEQDIEALVSREVSAAEFGYRTERSARNTLAIEYYNGEMSDVPEQPNRSKMVRNIVSETVDKTLPPIIRTFMAAGTMFEFEPVGPEDEEAANQASDLVSHIFIKENDGYGILYDSTHDALLTGDGIVKLYWDDYEDSVTEEYSGLDEIALTQLMQDPDIEILEQEMEEGGVDPMTGQPAPVFEVKVKKIKSRGCVKVCVIPPEDLIVDDDCIDLEDFRFVAHKDEVMRSDLVEMGFDKNIIDSLPQSGRGNDSEEKLAREGEDNPVGETRDDSTSLVDFYECYLKADVNGDGVSETIRAYFAGDGGGGKLLDWEEWEDELPFVLIPCEPRPHELWSTGLAEKVMPFQRLSTVMLRAAIDNQNAVNNPQPIVVEGSVVNRDSITSPKFGQPILVRKGIEAPVIWRETPYVGDKIFGMSEYVDRLVVERTGVSNSSAALDPETLQNQSATAAQLQHDVSYSRAELIARTMAELGWKKVGKKLLKLITKNQDKAKTIRLRGEWVSMDPRSWNSDMDCTVNVGLGTGSRDRDRMELMGVMSIQYQMMQAAVANGFGEVALEMLPMITKTATRIGEAAGIRNADDYYPDFTPERLQQMAQKAAQPKEDPKIALEKAKLQLDAQGQQQSMQMDAQKMQMEGSMKAQQQQADIELQREKMQQELMLKEQQLAAEMALKERQLVSELQLKREQMAAELQIKKELGIHGANVNAGADGSLVDITSAAGSKLPERVEVSRYRPCVRRAASAPALPQVSDAPLQPRAARPAWSSC
jgi:hypothetical protein